VDNNFVQEHRLQIDALKPGAFCVFIAAGETKIKAIGTVKLTFTFSGEEFPFVFQVVDRLSTNILLGMNFILHYHCVPYANREVFTLGNARVSVPMVVMDNCLGLAKLRKQVTIQLHTQQIVDLRVPRIDNQYICLIEPIYNRKIPRFCIPRTILSRHGYHYCQIWNPTDEPIHLVPDTLIGQVTPVSDILSIAPDNNPTKTNKNEQRQPETSYRQRRYDANGRSRQKGQRQTDQFGETGNRTFYSHNTNFVNNNNRYRQQNRNNTHNTENHHHGNGHNHGDFLSSEPLISSEPVMKHTFEELKIKLTNPDITQEQELKFRNLIDAFGDVFAVSNAELPGMDRLKFKINVTQDSRPIRQGPYSYSQEAPAEIERQIQEILAIKFIRHSISPWASNDLLVRK